METIRGRKSLDMDVNELTKRIANYDHILLDLGTGDGRFVRCLAEQTKERFFIGMDACRENLYVNSRTKQPNALFVIASAQSLPDELRRLVSQVSINFPWGSLLESLLNNDVCLVNGLSTVTRVHASMEILFNAGALATTGLGLESGADQIERRLNVAGWMTTSRCRLNAPDLRALPTTWAKRLAFGRDPRAIRLSLQKE